MVRAKDSGRKLGRDVGQSLTSLLKSLTRDRHSGRIDDRAPTTCDQRVRLRPVRRHLRQ